MKKYFFVPMLVLVISNPSAFPTMVAPSFTVNTDKTDYNVGDEVKVSGWVSSNLIKTAEPLTINIFNPDGKPYSSGSTVVTVNQTYSYNFKIEGGTTIPGEYTILIYNNNNLMGGSTIIYDKNNIDYSRYYIYPAPISNPYHTYPIRYKITKDVKLNGINIVPSQDTMYVGFTSTNQGQQLTIEIPRQVLDSKKLSDNTDQSFLVATGWAGAAMLYTNNFNEIDTNKDNRTLQFNLSGYDSIMIGGTQSIPEFGQLAAVISTVAILGMIVITIRKNSLYVRFKK